VVVEVEILAGRVGKQVPIRGLAGLVEDVVVGVLG
jgi:hypothetical protein